MILRLLVALPALFLTACGGPSYDLVIRSGRVMDPESGLDAVRNIGIQDGRVAVVTEDSISGSRSIDASGLVVAPGFVDLHQHGMNDESLRLKALDGVTSAFELEVGTRDVDAWYAEREGGQFINYGVSAGHIPVRIHVLHDPGEFLPSGPAASLPATPEQIAEMAALIGEGLARGAVAVGFGMAYTPAASVEEFETLLRVAAENGATAHIHVRGGLDGLREAVAGALETGTPLHVVHANSSGGPDTGQFLQIIASARAAGQDVTTEAYPYSASQTQIESALFDDWETWEEERYQTFQWVESGERLTRESFAQYREQGGSVIIHSRTEEMTRAALASPLTMIASDGGIRDGAGHPRNSGTYARVLGRYVREEGLIDLMEALGRMTLQPARRLEARAAEMRERGRIRPGAHADLTLFDPERIIDRATYTDGTIPSEGIEYVLVNGVLVVDGGEFVAGVRPGRPVRGRAP